MEYLDHERVAQSLTAAGYRADVHGEGKSRFVFAENDNRAVEVSASGSGVWVEYWDGDERPKFDRTFATVGPAVADAKAWLSGNAG